MKGVVECSLDAGVPARFFSPVLPALPQPRPPLVLVNGEPVPVKNKVLLANYRLTHDARAWYI